ncbi:MAG: helix-turn-helix transcriptional regulator [Clostridia bacterium]|nr:helix-turn-helix transcriptional regulator [Clostridia bacterium]
MGDNDSKSESSVRNAKMKKDFGAFIKKHRKAKKMTQQDLADALGITKKSVCAFESGMTFPSQENIFKLAKILDMSLDEFVFGESVFNHNICIKEINEMLASLSEAKQGIAIQLLSNIIETIMLGRES